MDTGMFVRLAPRPLAHLVKLSQTLNAVTDLDELLALIVEEAVYLTGAEAASILSVDPDTQELRYRATSLKRGPKLIGTPVAVENTIAGAVLKANIPILIADVLFDKRWNPDLDDVTDFQTRSVLGVPLREANRAVGVIEALNKREGTFTDDDMELLTILAGLAGVAFERTRLNQALRVANEQLTQLDQLKSDFITIASQALQSPLSIILGYASLLRETTDPALAAQVEPVLEAAVRLRSLIQDMLNLRFIDTGNLHLKKEPVDLVAMMRRFLADRDELIIAREQTVYANLPQTAAFVLADSQLLEVVISNLLSNAIKFTPRGGRINIDLSVRADEVWFGIRDTGIGIPKAQQAHVFTRFYQVEQPLTRSYDGLGVGLAIAKELVELHDGRIWVHSEPGTGSAFTVALPATIPPR